MTSNDEERWAAVVLRDQRADGNFVYAVKTTHIYCRPTCKARRARRANVTFYASCSLAEDAGYRACKRCRPELIAKFDPEAERISRACEMLHSLPAGASMPTLEQLATAVGLSKYHFHRSFKRETGLTPKGYLLEFRKGSSTTSSYRTPGLTSTPLLSGSSSEELFGLPWPEDFISHEFDDFGLEDDLISVRYCIVNSSRGRLLAAFQQESISWTAEDDDEAVLMQKFEDAFPPMFYKHILATAADVLEAQSMASSLMALAFQEYDFLEST